MKLHITAFREERRPIKGNEPEQPPQIRFVAELKVESIVGPDKQKSIVEVKFIEPSVARVAQGITMFLLGKNDNNDYERRITLGLGESRERKITFPDGALMVERSMLESDETVQITRAVDAAIYRVA